MLIKNDRLLRDVQQEFSEKYPYLKIEFFQLGKTGGEKQKMDPGRTIGSLRTVQKEGEISIHGNVRVRTLESNFRDLYGLFVQVFRLSGNIWLQTTSTDDWTLHEQNRKGGASVSHFKEKYES